MRSVSDTIREVTVADIKGDINCILNLDSLVNASNIDVFNIHGINAVGSIMTTNSEPLPSGLSTFIVHNNALSGNIDWSIFRNITRMLSFRVHGNPGLTGNIDWDIVRHMYSNRELNQEPKSAFSAHATNLAGDNGYFIGLNIDDIRLDTTYKCKSSIYCKEEYGFYSIDRSSEFVGTNKSCTCMCSNGISNVISHLCPSTNFTTFSPTSATIFPTITPTLIPSFIPTISPTESPTFTPTNTITTLTPSISPSLIPSRTPTQRITTSQPTSTPTQITNIPSKLTESPSIFPTESPNKPSNSPSNFPSITTNTPSATPTETANNPSLTPLIPVTTNITTNIETTTPNATLMPSIEPTLSPTISPSIQCNAIKITTLLERAYGMNTSSNCQSASCNWELSYALQDNHINNRPFFESSTNDVTISYSIHQWNINLDTSTKLSLLSDAPYPPNNAFWTLSTNNHIEYQLEIECTIIPGILNISYFRPLTHINIECNHA